MSTLVTFLCAAWWQVLVTPLPADATALARVARTYGVPEALFLAVAVEESGLSGTNAVVGRHGERGRLQVLARWWAPLSPHCQALDHKPANLHCGARVLVDLRARHGSWPDALRAYNGSGRAARAYRDRVLSRAVGWHFVNLTDALAPSIMEHGAWPDRERGQVVSNPLTGVEVGP